MAILRRFINTFTNKELNRLFLSLKRTKVRELVEIKGDIDQQGQLITAALTSPSLVKNFLRLFIAKMRYLPQVLWDDKRRATNED